MINRIIRWIIDKLRNIFDPTYALEKKAYEDQKTQAVEKQKIEVEQRVDLEKQQEQIKAESKEIKTDTQAIIKQIEEREDERKAKIDDIDKRSDHDTLRDKL